MRDKITGSTNVLVPLTNSLYVSGELASSDSVLVDVGTGFLVEKVREKWRDAGGWWLVGIHFC